MKTKWRTEEWWRCTECYAETARSKLLTAPNPFDPDEAIGGCPQCKSVNKLELLCSVDGCKRPCSCGWRGSDHVYRLTCGLHRLET